MTQDILLLFKNKLSLLLLHTTNIFMLSMLEQVISSLPGTAMSLWDGAMSYSPPYDWASSPMLAWLAWYIFSIDVVTWDLLLY